MICTYDWAVMPTPDGCLLLVTDALGKRKRHSIKRPHAEVEEELRRYNYRLMTKEAGLIQEELPNWSPDDREVLMTGFLPSEWDEMFANEENPR